MDNKQLLAAAVVGGIVGGIVTIGAQHLLSCPAMENKNPQQEIVRLNTTDPRSSGIVIHNGLVHLSGQVGDLTKLESSDVAEQTRQTLAKIDGLLAQAGTSKSRIIEARIWLKDIKTDFATMNTVWNAWVDPQAKGTRYCVEAHLARPTLLVEVQVTAAL